MTPSRRNASTAMRMKVAAATTAIDRTLRSGRYVALRRPRRDTACQPRPSTARRTRARNAAENAASADASSRAPATKNPPACGMRPAPDAARTSSGKQREEERGAGGRERPARCCRHCRIADKVDLSGQEAPLRDSREAPQRPPDARDSGRNTSGSAHDQRSGGYVQREGVGANGVDPPRSQRGHQQTGVRDGTERAQDAAARAPAAPLPTGTGGAHPPGQDQRHAAVPLRARGARCRA